MGQLGGGFGIGGIDLQLASLTEGYQSHTLAPRDVINAVHERTASFQAKNIWAYLAPREDVLRQLRRAEQRLANGQCLPLFGVPFAVADNIDVAGMPTTLGCDAYAVHPEATAPSVERLVELGAICMGKTNLDQLGFGLTGLSGATGPCTSAFDDAFIAGGASAGAALAVALGLVSFALATDSVGGTLVPAALSGVVGLRVTQGLVSSRGTTMGARTLESLGIIAGNAEDAYAVLAAAHAFDPLDPYARSVTPARARHQPPTIGVPTKGCLAVRSDSLFMRRFELVCRRAEQAGWSTIDVDLEPFIEFTEAALKGMIYAEYEVTKAQVMQVHPGCAPIAWPNRREQHELSAVDAIEFQHQRRAAHHALSMLWPSMDALLLPTIPGTFRVDELQDSVTAGLEQLGCYAGLAGLFDLSAVSVPSGSTSTPFGVTLLGPACEEGTLLALAAKLHQGINLNVGATRVPVTYQAASSDGINGHGIGVTPSCGALGHDCRAFSNLGDAAQDPMLGQSRSSEDSSIEIGVVGTHLQGEAHHHQLLELNAQFLRAARTASRYEMFVLTERGREQPALVRRTQPSGSVRVEVYRLQAADFGKLVTRVASTQLVGEVELEDGTWVKGFLCQPGALAGARDITKFGGWIEYQRARAQAIRGRFPQVAAARS